MSRRAIWIIAVAGFLVGAAAGLVIWQTATGRFGPLRTEQETQPRVASRNNGTAAEESAAGTHTRAESLTSPAARTAPGAAVDSSVTRPGAGVDADRNPIVLATRKVAPAVVSIDVVQQQGVQDPGLLLMERMGLVPPRNRYRNVRSMGSGVIISDDGLVVTNDHVVENAVGIQGTLSDGRQLEAHLLEEVPRYDLALLQVAGDDLPVAQLASEENLQIGEWVIAIGSPFGYLLADTQPTVTVGVVSALNRDIKRSEGERAYLGMIQTDAAINPGNSGGPLVDTRGDVVGINTFIFSESGGSVGIGFAVPASRVLRVVDDVRKYGHYREASLGFALRLLVPALARYLGLDNPVGAVVLDVEKGSPVWESGLRPGDILRTIDGDPVDNLDRLYRLFYIAKVGDHIPFTAERDGKEWSGEIVLAE